MHPRIADIAVKTTVDLIRELRLARGSRLLDAGCGDGRVAAQIARLGLRVTAIDRSAAAVRAAHRTGVPARRADLLHFDDAPFDAILCCCSMHHMHPLSGALAAIDRLLVPGGVLILEEFAHEVADKSTSAWFHETWDLLAITGVIRPLRATRNAPTEPLARWRWAFRMIPPVHTGQAIVRNVEARLTVSKVARVPFLYRLFGRRLVRSTRGLAIVEHLYAMERRLIADGSIRAVGLRVIARKRKGRRARSAAS